ncbi:MAG: isoprenylcysteine carboxylmethyltransferase family protein [Haliangium ochraceum]
MDVNRLAQLAPYLALLAAVGGGRLFEMRLSRRHQRALAARGFSREREPAFAAMVALHTAILVGAAVEVMLAPRPLSPVLTTAALVAFVLANLLRWWVIRTMAGHWNVQVVNALPLGVVTGGPFRFVRHPNYVAVFVELLALPLVHAAYVTALLGAAAHVVVLGRRIAFEESFLLRDVGYRAAMGPKPRFLPRLPRPWVERRSEPPAVAAASPRPAAQPATQPAVKPAVQPAAIDG